MATSSSTDFSVTATDIVTDAYIMLEAVGIGETLSGDDYVLGLRWLNYMVKTWQAQGLHLWTETEGLVFVTADQISYQLGGSGADRSSTEDLKTELAADAATSATSLTVDSTTGMTCS